MKIRLDNFKGARPLMAPEDLAHEEAQVANNCKIIKGDLRGIAAPLKQAALDTTDTLKTLYIYTENSNDHWVESANDCDFVKSPIAGETYERVFYTGESEPRFFANDNISTPFDESTDFYKLGIPAPTTAPTVTTTGGGQTYRGYVYSFVNSYGDEGPPSPVGSDDDFDSGYVQIDDIEAAPASRAIDTIYLYRTNASSSGTAEFQFVLEATWFNETTQYEVGDYVIYSTDLYKCTSQHTAGAWNGAHFTQGENVANADLLSVFPKTNYDPPPSGLSNLIMHPCGSLCGIYLNKLYMSEPYQPHAYPTGYITSFDSNPVAIGIFGTTIVVATEGYPQYLVYGDYPGQMTKEKLSKHYPCLAKRGMVSAEISGIDGILYPSKEGLVFVSGGGAEVITNKVLGTDDWTGYSPTTLVGCFYESKYIGFDSVGDRGFVLDFQHDDFFTISVMAHAYHLADDGTLYLALDDLAIVDEQSPPENMPLCVSEWEGSTTDFLAYTWRSKEFILDYPTNFAVAKILVDTSFYDTVEALFDLAASNASLFEEDLEGGLGMAGIGFYPIGGDTLYSSSDYAISSDLNFKLYADGTLRKERTVSEDTGLIRLPAGYLGERWYFEVTGYIPVKAVIIATSVDEL